QLADRWLFVLPVFQRGEARPDQAAPGRADQPPQQNQPGQSGQPGRASPLSVPPAPPVPNAAPVQTGPRGQTPAPQGPYSMCYAVSVSSDPMGEYYRYEF